LASLAITALAADKAPPQSKEQRAGTEITKAMYLIGGMHCGACATALEGSLKTAKGVQSIRVDFNSKRAMIEFDEKLISAQEVARAMSYAPHMMAPNMHYGGVLVLSVEGVKNKATGKKAASALKKVKGVGQVLVDPREEAIGVQFAATGKVTSKQLIEALDKAGLKAGQYHAQAKTGAVR
jgi:copper chaperone CopZ